MKLDARLGAREGWHLGSLISLSSAPEIPANTYGASNLGYGILGFFIQVVGVSLGFQIMGIW